MPVTMTRKLPAIGAAVALTLSLAGCADDAPTDEATAPSEAAPTTAATSEAAAPATVEVVTTDYAFAGLPGEVDAGTTLTIRNDSDAEVHEVLAFRIVDGEQRSAGELLALGEEGLMEVAELRGVLVAAPGEAAAAGPLGPLVLEQPGRYAMFCLLPTGAPPADVLAAIDAFVEAGAPEGGSPEYPQTGPPHAVNGMLTEVVVNG